MPHLTWIDDVQEHGSGLNFPTNATGGFYGDNGILWANFAVYGGVSTVPEPSTYALMFTGLLAVGVARRRSAKGRKTHA
ncbi:MAG: PEP-CTERM sorting domain-containing protein [Gemmatimonas sp.]